jgi:hypothetical protein
LLGSIPLLPHPRLVEQKLEIIIRYSGRRECPGTLKARTINVAAAESMCSRESYNFLVIETGQEEINEQEIEVLYLHIPHAVKNTSKVVRALSSIRETSIRCSMGSETVDTTWAPGNLGTSHFLYEKSKDKYIAVDKKRTNLNCGNTSESPKITIAYPRELLLDFFHKVASDVQTCIGTMDRLRLKAHGSVVAIRNSNIRKQESLRNKPRLGHLPPVLLSLSYVPEACQARRRITGP